MKPERPILADGRFLGRRYLIRDGELTRTERGAGCRFAANVEIAR